MVRHRRQAAISGFLNVHKPKGITSHQCVAIVRKIFNTTEVGHAGTLDPMATGVIVAAVGCATKFLQVTISLHIRTYVQLLMRVSTFLPTKNIMA